MSSVMLLDSRSAGNEVQLHELTRGQGTSLDQISLMGAARAGLDTAHSPLHWAAISWPRGAGRNPGEGLGTVMPWYLEEIPLTINDHGLSLPSLMSQWDYPYPAQIDEDGSSWEAKAVGRQD